MPNPSSLQEAEEKRTQGGQVSAPARGPCSPSARRCFALALCGSGHSRETPAALCLRGHRASEPGPNARAEAPASRRGAVHRHCRVPGGQGDFSLPTKPQAGPRPVRAQPGSWEQEVCAGFPRGWHQRQAEPGAGDPQGRAHFFLRPSSPASASGACASLPPCPVRPGLRGLGSQDSFEARPGCELANGQRFPQARGCAAEPSPSAFGCAKPRRGFEKLTPAPSFSRLSPKKASCCRRSGAPALLAEQLLLSQGFPGALKAFLLFSLSV